jgi:MoaA/NifB/PqqE/SkfB family radical SAM enzyme
VIAKNFSASNELVIVWRVTEQCNLGCQFCGYDRTLERTRKTADAQMALAFGERLRDYQLKSNRSVLISWLGGEPFLWRSLFDVSRAFNRDFGFRIAATTNGLPLSASQTREQIVALFAHLVVSVDGLGEFHDRVRGTRGAFDQIKSNVIALRELRDARQAELKIGANTILMHDNLDAFESLCSELADWGISEITFNTLGGRDRPAFFPAHRLTPNDVMWFRAQLPGIRARLSKRRIIVRGAEKYLDRIDALAREHAYAIHDCKPGTRFLFIDEAGLIAPCNFTVNGYGISLSQIDRAGDLERLPIIFARRQANEMLAPCFDCRSTQVFDKFDTGVSYES